jgi:hypothetical protein
MLQLSKTRKENELPMYILRNLIAWQNGWGDCGTVSLSKSSELLLVGNSCNAWC